MWNAGLAELTEVARREPSASRASELLPDGAAVRDVARLEHALRAACKAAPAGLSGAALQLVRAGGKRVRPMLVLLAARSADGRGHPGRARLAVAAELVHTASLLHDDVVDDGLTRRGLPAPRVIYGNAVAVLSGDWLLATALELAFRSRVAGAPEALSRAIRGVVEGEAAQLALRGRLAFTPDDALRVARLKTGALFGFCAEAGALSAGAPRAVTSALREFGERAGTAFQAADDLLDFEGDPRTLGKAVLADVVEGKPSLPVALALLGRPLLRQELTALARLGTAAAHPERLRQLAEKLRASGALEKARAVAQREHAAALAALARVPDSPSRRLLEAVTGALMTRST